MSEIMLIIQFKMAAQPDPDEVALLQSIEDALIERISEDGEAEVDGHDYGSGTMNVFVRVGDNCDSVIETTKACLNAHNILQRTIIAKRLPDESHLVVWPPDYQGEFNYM